MNKTELIQEMELSLQEGNLNNAIRLLNKCCKDIKNDNMLYFLSDKYITGQMITLANKKSYFKLEADFKIDNSTYYEHYFKCKEGITITYEIKQLTKESIIDTINKLKLNKGV